MRRSAFPLYPGGHGTAARGGFTTIELLVVVSIIAMLAALLLPAISLARGAAMSLSCQNQIRQIGLAIFAYSDDHHDTYPGDKWNGSGTPDQIWVQLVKPYIEDEAARTKPATFFKDPALPNYEQDVWWKSTYAMNLYLASGTLDGGVPSFAGTPVAQVSRSSEKMLVLGGTNMRVVSRYHLTHQPHRLDAPHPGGRHSVLYCDFHVGSIKRDDIPTHWRDPFWTNRQ